MAKKSKIVKNEQRRQWWRATPSVVPSSRK